MSRKELAEEEAMKWLATKYGTIRPDDAFVAGWLEADKNPPKAECPDENAMNKLNEFAKELK